MEDTLSFMNPSPSAASPKRSRRLNGDIRNVTGKSRASSVDMTVRWRAAEGGIRPWCWWRAGERAKRNDYKSECWGGRRGCA